MFYMHYTVDIAVPAFSFDLKDSWNAESKDLNIHIGFWFIESNRESSTA